MTKLKISIGKTYNTGNYTSTRLDVGFADANLEFGHSQSPYLFPLVLVL